MTDEMKAKVRGMSQGDIPIRERRALYNSMGRRFKGPGLKPGLLQKYNACLNSTKERWKLLKEFIIDEDMPSTQYIQFSTSKCFIGGSNHSGMVLVSRGNSHVLKLICAYEHP